MRDVISKPAWQVFGTAVASLVTAIRRAGAKLRREMLFREAAARLQAMSDYELRDIGMGRCEIDYKLRHPHER